jgi:RNA polymerase sigma factor (sigma-70 family)
MSGSSISPCTDPEGVFERALRGDEAAWKEVFDHCYEKVRRVVGRRLDRQLRTVFDSVDFTHDVFVSLVAKPDRFDFKSLDEVRAFLLAAAKRKVVDAQRRQHRAKRDVDRLQRFDDLQPDEDGLGFEPVAPDPTPSQHALGREARERILGPHTGPDRTVLELRELSYTNEEIAEKTGWHIRKVQRLVKKVSDSWLATRGR